MRSAFGSAALLAAAWAIAGCAGEPAAPLPDAPERVILEVPGMV
jgi:hypothetical protein